MELWLQACQLCTGQCPPCNCMPATASGQGEVATLTNVGCSVLLQSVAQACHNPPADFTPVVSDKTALQSNHWAICLRPDARCVTLRCRGTSMASGRAQLLCSIRISSHSLCSSSECIKEVPTSLGLVRQTAHLYAEGRQ